MRGMLRSSISPIFSAAAASVPMLVQCASFASVVRSPVVWKLSGG